MEVGRGNIVLQDLLTNDMPPPAALEQQQEEQQQNDENEKMQEVFSRIKTHFPPAKIKKIMQTDDDIGKVSQATPVIAGRSLEFFILHDSLLNNISGDTFCVHTTSHFTTLLY